MTKYIAFLRAINVGGTTLIKMTDLRRMFESFGLSSVQTYIQTGNVIFESAQSKVSALEQQIEDQLEGAYGKRIRLFVRTTRQVADMAAACPFEPKEAELVYVVILAGEPAAESIKTLESMCSDADNFAVIGREIYWLRRDRDRSIFSNNLIEKVLGVPGTTRNLTTIKKLAEKYT